MMPGLDYDTVQSNLQLLLKSKLMKQIETIGITMIEHNYVDEKEFFMMQKLCTEIILNSIVGAIWIGPETIHIGKIMFVATVFSAANKIDL